MLTIFQKDNPNLEKNKQYLFTNESKWHWFQIAYPNLTYKDFNKYLKTTHCDHCGEELEGKRCVKNKIICEKCSFSYF